MAQHANREPEIPSCDICGCADIEIDYLDDFGRGDFGHDFGRGDFGHDFGRGNFGRGDFGRENDEFHNGDGATLQLGECRRCSHRWTRLLPFVHREYGEHWTLQEPSCQALPRAA